MTQRKRNFWSRGDRGQAMVEFALILPVFLLLVVGMLEFSRAWNLHQVMTDAAREGARRMVLNEPTSDWNVARHAMWDHLAQFGYDPAHATMSYNVVNYKKTNEPLTVTLTLPYRFFVLSGLSITMRSSFTMRNE